MLAICDGEVLSKLRRPVKSRLGWGRREQPIHGPDRASRSACGRDKTSVVGEKGKKMGRERERYAWAKVIMEKATGARNVKWKWARIHQKRKGTFFGQGHVGWPVITVLTGDGYLGSRCLFFVHRHTIWLDG